MLKIAALFLSLFLSIHSVVFAQDTVFDWSKKVVELQGKEGQNFEQDLQLLKGLLHLQRRTEALKLIQKINKTFGKKDNRLTELSESASDQFFFQESAELYASGLELIKEESWNEAVEKFEAAIKKDPSHRLLMNRLIQSYLVTGKYSKADDTMSNFESVYPESTLMKFYHAWSAIQQSNGKDAIRLLSGLWYSERKMFEKNEFALVAFMKATELNKYQLDFSMVGKIVQKNKDWWCARLNFSKIKNSKNSEEFKKALLAIKVDHQKSNSKKIKNAPKFELDPFSGLISSSGCMQELEEALAAISETK